MLLSNNCQYDKMLFVHIDTVSHAHLTTYKLVCVHGYMTVFSQHLAFILEILYFCFSVLNMSHVVFNKNLFQYRVLF